MFSVPYTFANEDESYITMPALKRFAKEKKKGPKQQSLKPKDMVRPTGVEPAAFRVGV